MPLLYTYLAHKEVVTHEHTTEKKILKHWLLQSPQTGGYLVDEFPQKGTGRILKNALRGKYRAGFTRRVYCPSVTAHDCCLCAGVNGRLYHVVTRSFPTA